MRELGLTPKSRLPKKEQKLGILKKIIIFYSGSECITAKKYYIIKIIRLKK